VEKLEHPIVEYNGSKSDGLEDMVLQHVLIPLDGSPLAEQALQYAESLVGKAGKVTLLMVVELPVIYPMVSPSPPILPGEVEDYEMHRKKILLKAREYLNQISPKISMTNIQFHVVDAHDPAETIIEIAKEKQVDAIAMSTHGRRGLGRWLMGSVTQKVLQAAPCPILVIPNKVVANDKVHETK
jgi:nucleotide-binding universal stress UspA family protein